MTKLLLAALLPLAALAACASDGATTMASGELDRLRQDCQTRGGMLTPTGRITGEPALDYPCVIRGASSLPPR